VDTFVDARDRFLMEGGSLLPARDTLYAAIVELAESYEHMAHAWESVPQLDLSPGLPLVLNTIYRHHIKPQQVLSEARPWHTLDYAIGAKTPAQAHLELPITRTSVGHGIGLWFATQLTSDVGYSTEPRDVETVYGHLFLPWLQAVSLREGEICTLDLRAQLVGNDYVWKWETNIPASPGHEQVRFVQSSFYGSLFPPSMLQKRAMGFVPVLNEAGQVERWILQAIDGKRPLEDIAAEAARLFPHVFRRVEEAFNQVAEIAEKFSR
jgi:protein arginine N-methyltransferase 1